MPHRTYDLLTGRLHTGSAWLSSVHRWAHPCSRRRHRFLSQRMLRVFSACGRTDCCAPEDLARRAMRSLRRFRNSHARTIPHESFNLAPAHCSLIRRASQLPCKPSQKVHPQSSSCSYRSCIVYLSHVHKCSASDRWCHIQTYDATANS